MLASSVFKAYDVRGIVPDELDAEGAYRLAAPTSAAFEPAMMAIGHDMRLSSPELAEAAAAGAAEQGADVVELGQIGTEMLYFAVGEYGYEGGIQVTASHNPRRLQRHEDRPPRRPAGRRRHRPRPDQGASPRASCRRRRRARQRSRSATSTPASTTA